MTTLLSVLAQASLYRLPLASLPLLAQEEETASYGVAFLLLVLCLIGGVMAAVRADKRETDVKR
ncbi:hypothetical protein Pla123a_02180 [Posidoniimonas polymericola]|uniref:Uncharacterized protein n=1 Tax=Posidoniimonas polymericola TaxID=2528002 RepID=A0A5C5ZEZ5_9BACT|nr:hypothetical protein [Posidoniimonas polymericola]TWT85411.1 hypothetical protein Pla123a_02180 [Posidoniimonas polymericola]